METASEVALIAETVTGVAARYCSADAVRAARGSWSPELWTELAQLGLIGIGIPEELGGGGGSKRDALLVTRLLARSAAPIPFAETVVLAGWLREHAGFPHSDEPVSVLLDSRANPTLAGSPGSWELSQEFRGVPWGTVAREFLSIAGLPGGGSAVIRVTAEDTTITPGLNLAGEPRDTVSVACRLADDGVSVAGVTLEDLRLRAAVARVVMIAGALESVLALTVEHVSNRRQFGRPLIAFQAVRHSLARLASETMAATTAAAAVSTGFDDRADEFAIMAAKVRTAQAATCAAKLAHQLHGAIGLAREYRLAPLTERLWAWRDEFGSQRLWQQRLGEHAQANGPIALWEQLTEA